MLLLLLLSIEAVRAAAAAAAASRVDEVRKRFPSSSDLESAPRSVTICPDPVILRRGQGRRSRPSIAGGGHRGANRLLDIVERVHSLVLQPQGRRRSRHHAGRRPERRAVRCRCCRGSVAAKERGLRVRRREIATRSSDRRVLHGWRRRVRAMMTEVNVVDVDRGLARFRSRQARMACGPDSALLSTQGRAAADLRIRSRGSDQERVNLRVRRERAEVPRRGDTAAGR